MYEVKIWILKIERQSHILKNTRKKTYYLKKSWVAIGYLASNATQQNCFFVFFLITREKAAILLATLLRKITFWIQKNEDLLISQ